MMCHNQYCRQCFHTLPTDVQYDVADVVVGIDESLSLHTNECSACTTHPWKFGAHAPAASSVMGCDILKSRAALLTGLGSTASGIADSAVSQSAAGDPEVRYDQDHHPNIDPFDASAQCASMCGCVIHVSDCYV